MVADAGDPTSLVNWLIGHQRDVIWLIAIALGVAGWLSKRFGSRPPAGAPPRSRASDVLAGLRVALEAAQSGRVPGAPAGGVSRGGSPARSTPPRVPASSGRGAGGAAPPVPPRATLPVRPSGRAPAPLLDAFRDPAGARTAVILAEILAKPVALR